MEHVLCSSIYMCCGGKEAVVKPENKWQAASFLFCPLQDSLPSLPLPTNLKYSLDHPPSLSKLHPIHLAVFTFKAQFHRALHNLSRSAVYLVYTRAQGEHQGLAQQEEAPANAITAVLNQPELKLEAVGPWLSQQRAKMAEWAHCTTSNVEASHRPKAKGNRP